MMRRLLAGLALVVAFTTLGGCPSPLVEPPVPPQAPSTSSGGGSGTQPVTASLVVSPAPDSTVSAQTVLAPISLATDHYTVVGTGPEGREFLLTNVDGGSVTVNDLVLGSWSVRVLAFNQQDIALGEGTGAIDLSEAGGTLTIPIHPYMDPGGLDLSLSWPFHLLSQPAVEATLTPPAGAPAELDFTVADGSATAAIADLAPGYHLLVLDLTDGGVHRHSIVESVQVAAGRTTTGSFTVTDTELTADRLSPPTFNVAGGDYSGPITVGIAAQHGTIRYSLNGTPPTSSSGRIYDGPVDITSTTTLRAVAHLEGYRDSAVTEAEYRIQGSMPTPTVSPAEGIYYEPISVALSTAEPGAQIYFTLDGRDPNPGTQGSLYQAPVAISEDREIRAIAYDPDNATRISDVVTAEYRFTGYTGDPVIRPQTGTYQEAQQVAITTSTEDAAIYYTLDGTVPSRNNGLRYDDGFAVEQNTVVKAIAVKEDWGDSSVISAEYALQVAKPRVSPSAGTYGAPQEAVLTTATPDALIYYTTDESDPLSSETRQLYEDPIPIDRSTPLIFAAERDGWDASPTGSAEYYLQVAQPAFDPPPGEYGDDAVTVTISTTTEGATIVYGTAVPPATESDEGTSTAAVTLEMSSTLTATARKAEWESSDSVMGNYQLGVATVSPSPGDYAPAGAPLTVDFPNYAVAQAYEVEISTDDEFASDDIVESGIANGESSYTGTATISQNDVWFWRYRYVDASGPSDWYGPYTVVGDDDGRVEEPSLSVPPDDYADDEITVGFASPTPGVAFYATTDGTTPSRTNGTLGESITIAESGVLTVVAVKDGWSDSALVVAEYTLGATRFYPPDDGEVSDRTPLLDWPGQVPGGSYDVRVGTSPSFGSDPVSEASGVQLSEYEIPVEDELAVDVDYYWWARPAEGEWQGPYHFFIPFLAQYGFAIVPVVDEGETGSFEMGSEDEAPVHTVELTRPYSISAFEVTNEQFVQVFNHGLGEGLHWLSASADAVRYTNGESKDLMDLSSEDARMSYDGSVLHVESGYENHPVVEIPWYGAVVFCYLLNDLEKRERTYDLSDWSVDFSKRGYRLPTEAEWEYAARGGRHSLGFTYAGSDDVNQVAWHNTSVGSLASEQPVGLLAPNEIGAYDMSGNVSEWCNDWYLDEYYDESPSVDPTGPASGTDEEGKVIRGGYFANTADLVAIPRRNFIEPFRSEAGVGFRPVLAQ